MSTHKKFTAIIFLREEECPKKTRASDICNFSQIVRVDLKELKVVGK